MTLRELCEIYVNLLVFGYKTKSKARATIAIIIKQALGDMFFKQLETCFNVDTAIGPQLDIIGKYVGLPRNIGDPVPVDYFGFISYVGADPQNTNGFTDYTSNVNQNPLFYSYTFAGAQATDLNDLQYAFMIKLKIALNNSDASLYDIQNRLKTFFNGFITVTDNKDMTLTYNIASAAPVTPTVLLPYLPRPTGVGVNTVQFGVRVLADGTTIRETETGDIRVTDIL